MRLANVGTSGKFGRQTNCLSAREISVLPACSLGSALLCFGADQRLFARQTCKETSRLLLLCQDLRGLMASSARQNIKHSRSISILLQPSQPEPELPQLGAAASKWPPQAGRRGRRRRRRRRSPVLIACSTCCRVQAETSRSPTAAAAV